LFPADSTLLEHLDTVKSYNYSEEDISIISTIPCNIRCDNSCDTMVLESRERMQYDVGYDDGPEDNRTEPTANRGLCLRDDFGGHYSYGVDCIMDYAVLLRYRVEELFSTVDDILNKLCSIQLEPTGTFDNILVKRN